MGRHHTCIALTFVLDHVVPGIGERVVRVISENNLPKHVSNSTANIQ